MRELRGHYPISAFHVDPSDDWYYVFKELKDFFALTKKDSDIYHEVVLHSFFDEVEMASKFSATVYVSKH